VHTEKSLSSVALLADLGQPGAKLPIEENTQFPAIFPHTRLFVSVAGRVAENEDFREFHLRRPDQWITACIGYDRNLMPKPPVSAMRASAPAAPL